MTHSRKPLTPLRLYHSVDTASTTKKEESPPPNPLSQTNTSTLSFVSSSSSNGEDTEYCELIAMQQLALDIEQLEEAVSNAHHLCALLPEVVYLRCAIEGNLTIEASMEQEELVIYTNWIIILNYLVGTLNTHLHKLKDLPSLIEFVDSFKGRLQALNTLDPQLAKKLDAEKHIELIIELQNQHQKTIDSCHIDQDNALTLMRRGVAALKLFKAKHIDHLQSELDKNRLKTPILKRSL